MPGSGFVFGYLVTQQPFLPGALDNASLAFNVTSEVNLALAMPSVVVFKTLSVIYFFSFVCNILFYVGAVQWLTMKIGWVLRYSFFFQRGRDFLYFSWLRKGQQMPGVL